MKARWKIIVVLVALVFVSGYAGALIGARIQRNKAWRRSHPEAWNVSAMNTLERRLKLTPEQREKIQAIIDDGVVELKAVRVETIAKADAVIERMIVEADRELTPEQRVEFAKIKRDETNLDVLKVEPRSATPAPAPAPH
jgi:hypothetical protein